MAFSNRFGFNFGKVRQIVDVLLIIAALLIAFSTDTAITVREGTIISMLFFPPSMNFVYEENQIFGRCARNSPSIWTDSLVINH